MTTEQEFLAVESTKAGLVLRKPLAQRYSNPANYDPAVGLKEAIDSAMLLGMPLLLTGEPGTGKSQAARWLSRLLGLPLLRQDIKSSTLGRDLLYNFDEVARFRDASKGESRPLIDYVRFSALGEAVIRTLGGSAAIKPSVEGAALVDGAFRTQKPSTADLLPGTASFRDAGPQHSVVLIDEIDKAPRDTPNDLLAEFESLAFDVPELGIRIEADHDWRPIVLMTSNTERALPEPFLRRCLFFDIPPPDRDQMARIVSGLIADMGAGSTLFRSGFAYYAALRDVPGIGKKPGTSEFLAWLDCLLGQAGFSHDDDLTADDVKVKAKIEPTLICLVKTRDDAELASALLKKGFRQAS